MTARITYNGKNIDFPKSFFEKQIDSSRLVIQNKGVIQETLNVAATEMVRVSFRGLLNVDHADLKRQLQQWFQWAQEGKYWTFAADSTKTVLTTLNGGASAGATTMALTSTAGISADQLFVIRNLVRLDVVEVASVSSPNVTLSESLNVDFTTGSRFRTAEFWPGRLADAKHPIIEDPPRHYRVLLNFTEDVNSFQS